MIRRRGEMGGPSKIGDVRSFVGEGILVVPRHGCY